MQVATEQHPKVRVLSNYIFITLFPCIYLTVSLFPSTTSLQRPTFLPWVKKANRTVNIYWPAYYEISLLVWEWLCYRDKRGERYHIRNAIIRLRPKEGEMNWTNTQSVWAKSYTRALHWQRAHTLACMHCNMHHPCIRQWLRSTTNIMGYVLVKIKKILEEFSVLLCQENVRYTADILACHTFFHSVE